MEAQELRIGNYFYLLNSNEKQINTVGKITKNSVNGFPINNIEPIPLTEEWLVKFGFSECKTKGEYEYMFVADEDDIYRLYLFPLKDKWIIQLYNHYDAENRDDYERVVLPIPFKYVHQLQNLYHALTGEELTCI